MEHKQKIENEIKAMNYETFLKRGFRFNKRIARAHKMELLNFIDFKNGTRSKFLRNRKKQLSDIKSRLNKTIELIIENQNIDKTNEKALLELKNEIENSNSSADNNSIVESVLYFTQEN